ncbi:extended synaptotagmin-2 isoform X1 [Pelobates cultripes]|uniref:Extended synaptotagmin-2 isoform X1 n=1 Tax=Pelobates cultripes TaxID=61616 RepID=A0AAD1RV51_PELCU|nr:extended synaptotagmin-2 isoform X1 [Pelobates cultripes]
MSTTSTPQGGPKPTTGGSGQAGAPTPPAVPDDEPGMISLDITGVFYQFAKTFVIIFPVYVLGYFGFSFSWLLIALGAFIWWSKNKGNKNSRLNRALAFLENEEKAVKHKIATSDLPAWVHFPDIERAEWLNKTVKHMWPYICQFVDKLFRETIEPAVRGANTHLSTFSFTKIDMGNQPLRINGVKVYSENVDKRQIILDLQISFVGNTEIDLEIKRYFCRAGVKSIQLHGTMRVILEPLIGDVPIIGALSLFFLKKPMVEINWTGLTNILDIPGLNGVSDTIILDIISNYLVLPNRITVPLVSDLQIAQLRFPIPKGVLRIHFIEAQDLMGKDTYMKGLIKGKSDPYGVIKLGSQVFQTKVIKESLNPKWNQVYEALIYEHPGQELEIELFDEDNDKDDFLGSLLIDLTEVEKERVVDEWFTLDDATTGKLHLKLEWLSPLSTTEHLDEVLTSIRADKDQADDGLSSALLILYLDSARNLPSIYEGHMGFGNLKARKASGLIFCENNASLYRTLFSSKKMGSTPNPFVLFSLGHTVQESKVKNKTVEPIWEQTFTFFVHNPKRQELEIEVKDEYHQSPMGNLRIPLSKLLSSDDLTMNQRFQLNNSGPSSTLKMKIALRILHVEKVGSSSEDRRPSQVKRPTLLKGKVPSTPNTPLSPAPNAQKPPTPKLDLNRKTENGERESPSNASPQRLTDLNKSSSSLSGSSFTYSPSHIASLKEPTPSIASDISTQMATNELRQRLRQLQNGTTVGQSPLGQIQLTVRHSSHRNKLMVVVHSCRNLIAFSEEGSDPYVRLYLLPDKRRSGRRKTHVMKKTLNPIFDQTFEFSVSLPEIQRRTLDVAVKNSGGFLSRDKGLLGKLFVELNQEEVTKGWTQWYDLTEDGSRPANAI